MIYYIEYEVLGFKGIQKAGPYTKEQVFSQFDDIKSYEGVKNVKIIEE